MFFSFLKIGAFTIGGGYVMLPLIEQEFVSRRKWVSKNEIVDIFAISQSMPGVIAINASLFVGYKIGKLTGALIAAAGMILPSFFSILIIAVFFIRYNSMPVIQNAFSGIRAGVTALIFLTAIKLAKFVIKTKKDVIIAALTFSLIAFFDVHPIFVILFSSFLGFLFYRRRTR